MSDILSELYQRLAKLLEAEPDLDSERIVRIAKPSVRLLVGPKTPDSYPLGASRFGGTPDVPPDFVWPYWRPRVDDKDRFGDPFPHLDPIPLNFMAQIDLSAMPVIDPGMPQQGWLYFFYDLVGQPWGMYPHEAGRFKVLYVDCPRSELRCGINPDEINPDWDPKYHWAIVPHVELTLPGEYIGWEEYDTPRYHAYQRIEQKLQSPDGKPSRFLGHADLIQSPMENLGDPFAEVPNGGDSVSEEQFEDFFSQLSKGEFEVEDPQPARVEALENDSYPWRLLLQLDNVASDGANFFGGEGRIYFHIRKEDLRARKFDRVWLNLQTT